MALFLDCLNKIIRPVSSSNQFIKTAQVFWERQCQINVKLKWSFEQVVSHIACNKTKNKLVFYILFYEIKTKPDQNGLKLGKMTSTKALPPIRPIWAGFNLILRHFILVCIMNILVEWRMLVLGIKAYQITNTIKYVY